MSSSWIDLFAQKLIDAGLATPDTLEGCSEDEIAEIESTFAITLPCLYKQYLRKMGREAGSFLRECSRTYPGLVQHARETADTLLEARTNYRLPATAFVFVERYGCQFFFFDTADGTADPPVFRYFEGDAEPVQIAPTLSEALEIAFADELIALDFKSDEPYRFAI